MNVSPIGIYNNIQNRQTSFSHSSDPYIYLGRVIKSKEIDKRADKMVKKINRDLFFDKIREKVSNIKDKLCQTVKRK